METKKQKKKSTLTPAKTLGLPHSWTECKGVIPEGGQTATLKYWRRKTHGIRTITAS